MKFIYLVPFLIAGALVSCNKESAPQASQEPKEIVLNVAGDKIDMNVETKAVTAVTSMPTSLYWGATTGTRGNTAEAQKWAAASKAVSSNKIATGKYQPATAVAYNYYVANQTFTIPATGNVTMTVANADIVCGWKAADKTTSPAVVLNHIFGRTGTVGYTLASGHSGSVSGISYKIVGKSSINGTAGTYNLSTGAWTAASTKLTTATALTDSSDMYLIPGTYTLTVTYTYTVGDNVKSYTQSGDFTLVGGKINNISATLDPTEPSQINISVSLTAWSNLAVSVNVS